MIRGTETSTLFKQTSSCDCLPSSLKKVAMTMLQQWLNVSSQGQRRSFHRRITGTSAQQVGSCSIIMHNIQQLKQIRGSRQCHYGFTIFPITTYAFQVKRLRFILETADKNTINIKLFIHS